MIKLSVTTDDGRVDVRSGDAISPEVLNVISKASWVLPICSGCDELIPADEKVIVGTNPGTGLVEELLHSRCVKTSTS